MFSPVLSLMNRVRYWQKFSIIFFVFMVPFCWLSLEKLHELNTELNYAQEELQGLAALERLLPVYKLSLDCTVLQVIAQARQSDALLAAIALKQERFTDASNAVNVWIKSNSLARYKSEAFCSPTAPAGRNSAAGDVFAELQRDGFARTDQMKEVALVSGLSLDRENSVNRSIDLFVSAILPLYRTLAKTRSLSGYVTAYGYLESASKTSVLGQAGDLEYFVGLPQESTGDPIRSLIAESASKALELYQQRIVDTYAASSSYDEASTSLWAQRDEEYQVAIESLDRASQMLFAVARSALEDRVVAHEQRVMRWTLILVLVVATILYLFVGFYLSVRDFIRTITSATSQLADGNLSQSIQSRSRDELGGLANDFNNMQYKIRDLIAEVVCFSDSTRTKAEHVSEVASNTQVSAARQSAELELISASMAELVSSVQEISRSSHSTSNHANRASDKCSDGRAQVTKVVNGIHQLFEELNDSIAAISAVERESQEIVRAVAMIRSVSEQTNLLALNAAIEAARAGEQGRGFAVVADEVRSLATRSQGLTEEINSTIERLRLEVENAVRKIGVTHTNAGEVVKDVGSAAAAFEDITEGMAEIVQYNLQIAAAAEQQASVVESVERNAREINTLSNGNTQSANHMVQVSEEVVQMTRGLHGLVGNFKL